MLYEVITLPQGGHPIPASQPMISMKMKIISTELVAKEKRPTDIIRIDESTRPITRNFLASDLSESAPMRNLLKAYAMDIADRAIPSSSLVYPRPPFSAGWIIPGIASARFFLTR